MNSSTSRYDSIFARNSEPRGVLIAAAVILVCGGVRLMDQTGRDPGSLDRLAEIPYSPVMNATLTSKGQVTLPKELRARLKLDTGSRLDFTLHADNTITVKAVVSDARRIRGFRCRFHQRLCQHRARRVQLQQRIANQAELVGHLDRKSVV